jgi:transposase-like protein
MNETVREWERKSARRSPIRSDSARLFAATNGIWMGWVISIAGELYWLWRAVDQMASFSTSWSSVEETVALRSSS